MSAEPLTPEERAELVTRWDADPDDALVYSAGDVRRLDATVQAAEQRAERLLACLNTFRDWDDECVRMIVAPVLVADDDARGEG